MRSLRPPGPPSQAPSELGSGPGHVAAGPVTAACFSKFKVPSEVRSKSVSLITSHDTEPRTVTASTVTSRLAESPTCGRPGSDEARLLQEQARRVPLRGLNLKLAPQKRARAGNFS